MHENPSGHSWGKWSSVSSSRRKGSARRCPWRIIASSSFRRRSLESHHLCPSYRAATSRSDRPARFRIAIGNDTNCLILRSDLSIGLRDRSLPALARIGPLIRVVNDVRSFRNSSARARCAERTYSVGGQSSFENFAFDERSELAAWFCILASPVNVAARLGAAAVLFSLTKALAERQL